mgnify:CR=1 FL=1
MSPEAELRAALEAAPTPPRLWWRDDDAGRDHPRLDQLLALAQSHDLPIGLAIVPEWLEADCIARVQACPQATVLQHGIAHENHGWWWQKTVELGGRAPTDALGAGLKRGLERLRAAFGGSRFLPMLVPPWNRIAPRLVPTLPALGFTGLSTYGGRSSCEPVPGLRQVNTHLDLIAWREDGRPLSFDEAARGLAALIRARPHEPIGILSHHLVSDDGAFAVLDRLLEVLQDRGGPGLCAPASLLGRA